MRGHQGLDRRPRRVELRIDEAGALYGAVGFTPLHAMQSRRRQFQGRKQFVECRNSSSAHQRQGAPEALRDFAQQ